MSTTLTLQVGANADDGYIYGTSIDTAGSRMTVGKTSNITNIFARWTNITIPKGSTINSAKIQCRAYASDSGVSCKTRLYFNAEDNADSPTTNAGYIAKTTTTAYVDWTIPALTAYTWYDSPDITDIIQEIVDRDGWASGNAMMLLHKDNGSSTNAYRQFCTKEYPSGFKLVIEYTAPVSNIKTVNGLAKASVKTWNGLAIASVKSIDGLT